MWQYSAEVVRIVDGDTVDLKVDLGFRTFFTDRFRLTGIDAPERGQLGWSAATDYLASIIPVGLPVRIETDHPTKRDPRDSFGRWLATVYVSDSDEGGLWTNVNEDMISAGHAVRWTR